MRASLSARCSVGSKAQAPFHAKSIEALGNKTLLEKRINIRASDYRFEDKKKYYLGFTTDRGVQKKGTAIHELAELAEKEDFTEADIKKRTTDITDGFIQFLKNNNLIIPR